MNFLKICLFLCAVNSSAEWAIRPLDGGESAVIEPGTKVWTDRAYTMAAWPDALGKPSQFIRSSIQTTRLEVLKAGYITVLTPLNVKNQSSVLLSQGFRYVDMDPFYPFLINDGTTGDRCMALQKTVQPGDVVEFGYYGIAAWGTKELPTKDDSPLGPEVTIPTVDISGEINRQSVVAWGTETVYQGHPDTVLMPDGYTLFCTWVINHAGHLGPLSKSTDGGKTWGEPLPTPADWETVSGTTPVIHYLVDPQGKGRLFVMAGCDFPGRLRQCYSEDGGQTWTPVRDTGLKAECPPKTILSFDGGNRLVMWCDRRDPNSSPDEDIDPVVFQSESLDGGLTWSEERIVVNVPTRWAQPAVVRDPNNPTRLLMLLRYNGTGNGRYSVSENNGETWSEVRELPPAMTGHRYKPLIAPDGRMVVVMRDTAVTSPTVLNFVAWVGTFDDVLSGREGQYRIKLLHSYNGWDFGYSGFELLSDGTFVATTYIKYTDGPEKNSVVSTRFKLEETDAMLPGS